VKGPEVRSLLRRPARRTGGHAGPKVEHDRSGFERDGADASYARSALAGLIRDTRLMVTGALEMIPSASMTCCPGATSRDEEVAYGLSALVSPVPRWRASVRLTLCQTAVERESRCVPLPRVASGRLGLKSAATLTNRSGEGASCCALRATSSKHAPRGPEADVGSGDQSPRENENKLRSFRNAVKRSVDGVSLVRVPPSTSLSVEFEALRGCGGGFLQLDRYRRPTL
jgi:hypothetical protein